MVAGGQPFGCLPGVHEEQCGFSVVDYLPRPFHHSEDVRVALKPVQQCRVVFWGRALDLDVEVPVGVVLAHDHLPVVPRKESGDVIDVTNRCRQSYPLIVPCQQHQSLEGDAHLCSSLRVGQFVYLVHDHPFNVLHVLHQVLPGEHDLQCLGGGDEDIRRVLRLVVPLGLGGVAVSHADLDVQGPSVILHPLQHVPVEGPEGGDVDASDAGLAFGAHD